MSAMDAANIAALRSKTAQMRVDYDESLDTIWMLLAGMLVFFMHAGFTLLESGSVTHKNTQNILGKNLIVVTLGFLCWYAVGYPVALGTVDDPSKFAGWTNFFMANFWEDKNIFRVWFFQGAFCATGGTIVSGAMAERTKLKGFAIYITCMTAFIYPVIAYWGWSGAGFLSYENDDGEGVAGMWDGPAYMDFAGSGIVHMVGGVGALCGAIIVGPRKGRYDEPDNYMPHNVPFCVLGTFCLWFGWYGFNPGSTLAMSDFGSATTAGLVAVNTTLAPCFSGPIVFALRAFLCPPKALDVSGFCNGILAGLVAITAGCPFVKPWEAMIIGILAGFIYQGTSMLMQFLHIDDVVDAFAVHGANGLFGILALGFFGDPDAGIGGNGVFYGGTQLGTQLLAAFFIILWTAVTSVGIFLPLRLIGFLRQSDEFQDAGADEMEHSPPKAYTGNKVEE